MIPMEKLTTDVINGYRIKPEEVLAFYGLPLEEILDCAEKIRRAFKDNEIKLCSIVNAKSGECSEDCRFCSQSARSRVVIEKYPLVDLPFIQESFQKAKTNRASCFGIVTSGRSLSDNEIDRISSMVQKLRGGDMGLSVSLGELNERALRKLKKAGIKKIHCNIETAESYFPSICTTHTYRDKVSFIALAKSLGFEICCGVLFGLGENYLQRMEAAFALRELGVDSVPMNFFNPIEGTELANEKPLEVDEILRTIALFRFVLPNKDIRVCGGRETNLGDSQNMIFKAGANGMMVGGYLTTAGREVEKDHKMIFSIGLKIHEHKSQGNQQ